MKINNPYLRKIINISLGEEKEDFSKEELSKVTMLNIEEEIDFNELTSLTNLEVLKIYDLDIAPVELGIISSLSNLKELYFLHCNIESMKNISGLEIETLYITDSTVGDIKYLNNIKVNNLFLVNMLSIDLNDISIIRNVETLCLDNTKVLNEDKMIYMDKIVNLGLANTGIKNIDTLIGSDTLKSLVIDKEIYKNNIKVIDELKRNGVYVVDEMNYEIKGD